MIIHIGAILYLASWTASDAARAIWDAAVWRNRLFGISAAAISDMNLDGVGEVAVGLLEGSAGQGKLLILSGKAGASIATIEGPRGHSWFGYSLAVVPEAARTSSATGSSLLVGSPREKDRSECAAFVVSCSDSSILAKFTPRDDETQFGEWVAVCASAKSTASTTFVVHARHADKSGEKKLDEPTSHDSTRSTAHRLVCFAIDGQRKREIELPMPIEMGLGVRALWQVADLDGAGEQDVCVAWQGGITAVSIETGRVLWTCTPSLAESPVQLGLCNTPDSDHDGIDDMWVSHPFTGLGAAGGTLNLISGKSGRVLRALTPKINGELGSAMALIPNSSNTAIVACNPDAPWNLLTRVSLEGTATTTLTDFLQSSDLPDLNWGLSTCGDVDKDGQPDILIQRFTRKAMGNVEQGVAVVSSTTGKLLWSSYLRDNIALERAK